MKRLSKSRYTLFSQCPKALWLRIYKPEVAEVDEALQARFEQGNEVGDLAMKLFGDFKEVTTHKEDGSLDIQKMIDLTRQYMDEGVENVCEASFSCEGGYCAVDILRKTQGGWAIYEVKSTSFPMFNEKPAKLEKYAPDIAYQKWVLTQCGVNVTGTYLVCLNSDYVRQGDLDLQQLFVTKDMGELVENEYLKVVPRVSQAINVINSEEEPVQDLWENCNKPYHCAFWTYCTEKCHLPKPSVFDVYGGQGRGGFSFVKKLAYYHEGLITYEDLRNKSIGKIQKMLIEAALTGQEFIDKEGIRKYLEQLSYPLYFLDYETMQDAIPQYDGAKPYSQITFQYSLHVKESENSPYRHEAFLAPSNGKDPRRALAEKLCKDIPKDVCVLAYNKTFEYTRTNELAALFPDLADHLHNIANNLKDLIDPFRAGDYYVPAMGGSFSIKSVLPALFPGEKELDYHNLDEQVQNGGDAMTIFPKMRFMSPEEEKSAREALFNYCKLDTWAMVKVWERLEQQAQS